jgi:polyketide biosynthesis acyl carrier protein
VTKEQIFAIIKSNLLEILPDLNESSITLEVSMKDIGTNSIDRADVILQTMETLNLKFSLHELGGINNIQGLVDFLHAKTV